MTKYYLDTCIWIDFIEDRYDGMTPLGEYAFQFLKKCRHKKYEILYSNAIIFELNSQKHSFEFILNEFSDILIGIKVSKKIHLKAKQISNVRRLGYNDVLHALLSKENKALLISRDSHFIQLRDICEFKKPEELL